MLTADLRKVIDFYTKELFAIQAGRATKESVENIHVATSYGLMPLGQIASLVVTAQSIKIEPRDKGASGPIEKALREADTGMGIKNEGSYIFCTVPALTGEKRQELIKKINKIAEEIKARIRQVRQDHMQIIKDAFTAKEIGEDDKKREEKTIEDTIKDAVTEVDSLTKAKEKEIMTV